MAMYVPGSFEVRDRERLFALMEAYNFATLVSQQAGDGAALVASHLPLLVDRDAEAQSSWLRSDLALQGALVGHMARANSQWETAEGGRVLAIFQGPHAYISPQWYEAQNVVPTWNYATVHAYGVLRIEEDRERVLKSLHDSVGLFEGGTERPWELQGVDGEFIDRLLDGIVGFRIEIDRLEGKWKLSQNHDAARRRGVIEGLRRLGTAEAEEMAMWMERELEG